MKRIPLKPLEVQGLRGLLGERAQLRQQIAQAGKALGEREKIIADALAIPAVAGLFDAIQLQPDAALVPAPEGEERPEE